MSEKAIHYKNEYGIRVKENIDTATDSIIFTTKRKGAYLFEVWAQQSDTGKNKYLSRIQVVNSTRESIIKIFWTLKDCYKDSFFWFNGMSETLDEITEIIRNKRYHIPNNMIEHNSLSGTRALFNL